ncbi:MAG: hypothetical protein H6Q14_2049 [Bacteroidetes bacterium]|nr:hypothetical protein [Bacteroidota bacterium]
MKEYSDKNEKENKFGVTCDSTLEFVLQAVNDPKFAASDDFHSWLAKSDDHKALYDECTFFREAALNENKPVFPDIESEWLKFSAEIDPPKSNRKYNLTRWPWIAAAIVISFVLIFPWILQKQKEEKLAAMFEKEVVLQTEDGEIVPVETVDKQKAESMGLKKERKGRYDVLNYKSKVDPSNNPKNYTYMLNIPKGKAYQLVLEDGTEVWINTGTKITFPRRFRADQRVVELDGEAYFKVTKDSKRPFIVKTHNLSTLVMGTEFNVRAYEKEEASVTLVTGKVAVTGEKADQTAVLSPGQNATVGSSGLVIREVDTENYTAWKDGYFYFDEASLEDIMKEASRWYNIEITFSSPRLKNLRFKFWADRSQTFQDAVSMLNQVGKVSIKMTSPNKAVVYPATKN